MSNHALSGCIELPLRSVAQRELYTDDDPVSEKPDYSYQCGHYFRVFSTTGLPLVVRIWKWWKPAFMPE